MESLFVRGRKTYLPTYQLIYTTDVFTFNFIQGIPKSTLHHFVKGIPSNWKEILDDALDGYEHFWTKYLRLRLQGVYRGNPGNPPWNLKDPGNPGKTLEVKNPGKITLKSIFVDIC